MREFPKGRAMSADYKTCHDCGAKEGELHQYSCDMERCPFCGHQLITCDCRYEKLDLFNVIYGAETSHLPPRVYYKGLNDSEWRQWQAMLEAKGRFPYIVYPVMCAKCGKLWSELFHVPDAEWEHYIEPGMRSQVLCRECYDYIRRVTDERKRAAAS